MGIVMEMVGKIFIFAFLFCFFFFFFFHSMHVILINSAKECKTTNKERCEIKFRNRCFKYIFIIINSYYVGSRGY